MMIWIRQLANRESVIGVINGHTCEDSVLARGSRSIEHEDVTSQNIFFWALLKSKHDYMLYFSRPKIIVN
jgi:hypothetical protein